MLTAVCFSIAPEKGKQACEAHKRRFSVSAGGPWRSIVWSRRISLSRIFFGQISEM